jgi:hypothetical protein
MSEVSNDGVLAVHPHIEGVLSLALPVNSISPEIVEYVKTYEDLPEGVKPAGRSAAGQLGSDLIRMSGITVVY